MCGIFALLNNRTNLSSFDIERAFYDGNAKKRGPDHSSISKPNMKMVLGFHRLAINGLNAESNQPIVIGDISLICNGEIYNYRELYAAMNVEPTTQYDCEVIIHLYKKYGIEQTLQMLDGVFAFILTDNRIISEIPAKTYVARDPYGVRPLYQMYNSTKKSELCAMASDIKTLSLLHESIKIDQDDYSVADFPPGHFAEYELGWGVNTKWTLAREEKYHSFGFNSNIPTNLNPAEEMTECIFEIQKYLIAAVHKRCCTTDRPIACLLSGGLDSSLITALVVEYHKIHGLPMIETYSIGLEGSEDLKYAKKVADYLGTKHTEIILTEQDFIDAVPNVIHDIGSYDTTTVRASIGNWLIGKYIAEHSDAKVIFNGDGSDELCGGYIYMHKCPDEIEFDKECRRLLTDIHKFDVLRSDRCISCHGLEPRTPFLDRSWVQYYLSILPEFRFHVKNGGKEKYLLRAAFSPEYLTTCDNKPFLPDEILWRKKEAFSDGVTGKSRSLYQILQEHASTHVESLFRIRFSHIPPETADQYWYRYEFSKIYGSNFATLLPYYWMPKYVEAKDASARTLDVYSSLG
jgi:asparagine synthase (glutamine-hydrolysing)